MKEDSKKKANSYFRKVSISTVEESEELMLTHTAKMSHAERLAYLQQLREISYDPNLSEEEKRKNFKKIKINPPDENS
ncbi:MAG: hypothetical protein KBH11_10610 [Bacteroidia bacterium]|nr:hypothetical protein [Bacteroidia bacterium]